jgi:UDP-3-O-acyl-N-acetylglucosamine deacetylase
LILNVPKCKTVSFHRKWDPITSVYSMNGESLDNAATVGDLGVIFEGTLKFET